MKQKKIIYLFILFVIASSITFAQEVQLYEDIDKTKLDESINYRPLPNGYTSIMLGMTLENVEEELFSNEEFLYRGSPDVSLLPQTKRKIIDCEGSFYIKHAYFQFSDEKLYVITLLLNTENVDYFSMYDAMTKKYGPPVFLDPSKTVWRNDEVELSLEKPLSVKYIDKKVFDNLKENIRIEKSAKTKARIDFINNF